jgi:hypothetical protein
MSEAYRQPGVPFPQPPDSTPDFAAMGRKRRKRLFLAAGVAGVVAAAGVGVFAFATQRAARQATESAASDLRACLLQGPLDPGEPASLRFRRLQLVAMARPDAERLAPGAHVWPRDCHASATRAYDVLKGDGVSEAELKPLGDLGKQVEQPASAGTDLSTLVDSVVALLDKSAPGVAVRAGDPLPSLALTVDALAKVPSLSKEGTSLGHSFTEDNPGLSLPVLIDEKDLPGGPLLCAFRAEDADASCRTLAELKGARQQGLRLLGTSDPKARPLLFAGQRGSEGVFQSGSGAYADKLYSYGGYSREDGSIAILGWDEKAKHLVLSRKAASDAPALRLTLKPDFRVGNYFYGSQILWDAILVRGVTRDNERRLFVLPLADADQGSFELADIGELPEPGWIGQGEEEQPHLSGCKSGEGLVVRVRGEAKDYLTFRIGGRFSRPVSAPAYGLLGCYDATATVLRVEGGAGSLLIEHAGCTSAGCVRTALKHDALDRGSNDLRPLDPERIAAVDLHGKLVVVWSAGERGGLRLKMASPETFERASDVLVFDDHVKDGKVSSESTLLGFRLFSRERFAVLLVSTLAGLHAIRIDMDGKVTPWPVRQE